MILFQITITLFSVLAIHSVWKKFAEKALSKRHALLWFGFWLGVLACVWYPNGISQIAGKLGIGRGVDLAMYAGFAVVFFLLFRIHIHIEKLERQLTKAVRQTTLSSHEKK